VSRTLLRNVSAAVFLTTLVCLAATPAAAQPSRAPQLALVETEAGLLARVWSWLSQAWAPTGGLEQEQMKASSATPIAPDQLGGAGMTMNRGGTYDPNGSS